MSSPCSVEPGARRAARASLAVTSAGSPMISLVGGCGPGDQDLWLGEQQRIGAVDRGLGGDAFVAPKLRGKPLARAHQQDRGDHGKAQNAERERQRRNVLAVEQPEGRDIGIECRDREWIRRLGACRCEREQRGQHITDSGAESVLPRMSPGSPRSSGSCPHARLPQIVPFDVGRRRLFSMAGGGVPHRATAREAFTPNGNRAKESRS